jgi:site-specific DNA-methyltransferase (adenine-specific)
VTFTLNLGDCLAGMATLPDRSVDSVVTDPPYEAEAHSLQRRVKRNAGKHDGGDSMHVCQIESLKFPPMTEAERIESARQFARVARRWVVVFCQIEAAMKWRDALVGAGLSYRRTTVWVKPDGMPQLTGDRPGMGYESIVIAHRAGRSRWNGGGRCGVWTFNKIGPDDVARTGHETQKPLALMEALVRDFTDRGETILDPFAGSGTTGVAALRNGRNFIGWERDATYHAAATKRLSAVREQVGLFAEPTRKPKQASLLTKPEAA